jgi:plasmid stabilization system protein ParE
MRLEHFHELAEAEMSAAAEYYEQRQPGLGTEFIAEVRRAVEVIMRNPECGSLTDQEHVRSLSIKRFPYSVVFVATSIPPVIVAVYHQRRRPDGWTERL